MEKEQLKNIFKFLEDKEQKNAPLLWKLINNEPLRKENLNIDITESDDDIHIDYEITVDGYYIEFEGILEKYHTGRSVEYEFNPTSFMNPISEKYYDHFWQEIEDEILNEFYKM